MTSAQGDLIPDYGDHCRHGEAISSSIAESTVNQVISRRFVKNQQMRWPACTAAAERIIGGPLGCLASRLLHAGKKLKCK
jgi:hypothetical protein